MVRWLAPGSSVLRFFFQEEEEVLLGHLVLVMCFGFARNAKGPGGGQSGAVVWLWCGPGSSTREIPRASPPLDPIRGTTGGGAPGATLYL